MPQLKAQPPFKIWEISKIINWYLIIIKKKKKTKQKKSLKKLPMTGLDYNWIKRRMNFAHTQKSYFTIVIQKSLLKSQIMNLESQKSQVLFFGLLLLLLKFDILKGTKIEGEPILGFRVLIKTNSKSNKIWTNFLNQNQTK